MDNLAETGGIPEAPKESKFDKKEFNEMVSTVFEMRNISSPQNADKAMSDLATRKDIVGKGLNEKDYQDVSLQILEALVYYSKDSPLQQSVKKELLAIVAETVATSTSAFEQIINEGSSDILKFRATELLKKALRIGNSRQQQDIRNYLMNNLKDWRTKDHNWRELAVNLFKTGTSEQVREAFLWLDRALQDPSTKNISREVVICLATDNEIDQQNKEVAINQFLVPLLSSFGLDFNDLKDAWIKASDKTECEAFFRRNLYTIFELERAFPEAGGKACTTLIEFFGIKNFARYPLDLLKDMYQEREIDRSYGLGLYPSSDNNGAFYDKEPLENFYDKLKKLNVGLRIYECGSKYELVKTMVKTDKRYGKTFKPAFLILAGHGTHDSIRFGEQTVNEESSGFNPYTERGMLYQADFEGKGAQRMHKFLEDDAPLILFSCSTGAEGGIAQTISTIYRGHETSAPSHPATFALLEPTIGKDGKLKIDARFTATATKKYFVPNEAEQPLLEKIAA